MKKFTDLASVLDFVIPAAIKATIDYRNPNSLDKIIYSLREYDIPTTNKILDYFITFCHNVHGLAMPADTVVYARGLNRMMCNIDVLTEWFEINQDKLSVKFSTWVRSQKEKEKAKNAEKELKAALRKVSRIIEEHGYHKLSPAYNELLKSIKVILGE